MAATVETVTRVGPCEAEVKLLEIRDVRETKRKKIIERAAELLKAWDQNSLESSEIKEKIDTDIKLGEIISWGPENLPAGPDVESSPELIIVEGRADVLNLLRIDIKNTVAVQGTQIPKSIIELTFKKEKVTAFLDGDRGGTIILNELTQLAKVDYVARAPEGYEVEELTRKQLIKSLQNIKPLTQIQGVEVSKSKETHPKETPLEKMLKKVKIKNPEPIKNAIDTIEAGLSIGFSKNLEKLFEISVGEVYEKIQDFKDIQFLIIHGILSKRLLSVLMKMKLKFIACKNKEEDLDIPDQLTVFFF